MKRGVKGDAELHFRKKRRIEQMIDDLLDKMRRIVYTGDGNDKERLIIFSARTPCRHGEGREAAKMKLFEKLFGGGRKESARNRKRSKPGNDVFAPIPGTQEFARMNSLHPGALNANVIPKLNLEWMNEKNQSD